jgi:hypothetical protein
VRLLPHPGSDGLKGGFTYADAQTDDARLVLELVSGAVAAGAMCVNYCKLTGITETDGRVSGATVQDQLNHTNPDHPNFRLGKTLGAEYANWRRVKNGTPDRYRLFFRFASRPVKLIVNAWFNDEDTLRKAGSKTDKVKSW